MNRPNNQRIEQYYFEQFRKHYPMPEGKLTYSDRPDVIVRGDRVIGIEIANVYISPGADASSEQVQRWRRLETLERAHALHLATGGKRIELSVDFEPAQPICDIESVARALADVAKRIEDLPTGQIAASLFCDTPQLRFVYSNADECADSQWRLVQCYQAPVLSLERLRQVVQTKSQKSKEYQPCDVYWLLLVVDFMNRAQDQEILLPSRARLGASPFERILLYKPQFAQVVEVAQ